MRTGDVLLYLLYLAIFFGVVYFLGFGASRRLAASERWRGIVFWLGSSVTGFGFFDVAPRLVSQGNAATSYLFVIGTPLAVIGLLAAGSRLGSWTSVDVTLPRTSTPRAKSRAR